MKTSIIGNISDTIQISPTTSYCFFKAIQKIGLFLFFLLASLWIKYFSIISIIFLGMAFYKFFYLRSITYFVSEETIKVRTGIFSHFINTLELYRVKDYMISQSFFMRLFKIMTLTLYTTDLNSDVLHLEGIPVSDISNTIRDNVQAARIKNKIFEIN